MEVVDVESSVSKYIVAVIQFLVSECECTVSVALIFSQLRIVGLLLFL